MEDYYWDSRIDYLKSSRYLYFNENYIEFLIKKVWNFSKPVHIVDFGCGTGFIGLKFMPYLPKESKYTGIDKGKLLISEAKKLLKDRGFEGEFILYDLNEIELTPEYYDIATCQTLLMHLPNPKDILFKMKECIKFGGSIICSEPHWDSAMANFYMKELKTTNLGILQKLYDNDFQRTGKDGNIGIKIPIYMQELGLKNIECRISDAVRYLHPYMDKDEKKFLHKIMCDEFADSNSINNEKEFIKNLMSRGVSKKEAQEQFEIEKKVTEQFKDNGINLNTIFAPTMMITIGKKE